MKTQLTRLSTNQWLLFIILVAALLRFSNLGSKSIWLDEAYSAIRSQEFQPNLVTKIDPNHPTLHFLILYEWTELTNNSELMLRLPSALVSTASVGVLFLLTRRISNDDQTALFATALFALSPLDIWYGQEARMYAFIVFFALVMALSLAWNHWRASIGILVGLCLGLYTGYLIFPLWIALSSVWLVYWWQKGRNMPALFGWVVASGWAWWLYQPWWGHFGEWFTNALVNHWTFARLAEALGLPSFRLIHFVVMLLLLAVGMVMGSWLFQQLLNRPMSRWLIIVGVIGVFVVATLLFPLPRLYSVKRVLVTGWWLVIGLSAWLVGQLPPRPGKITRRTLLAISLLASLITVFAVPKEDWRSVVAYLEQNIADDTLVWLDPAWNRLPATYYAPDLPIDYGGQQALRRVSEQSDEVWIVAERYPTQAIPSSTAEAWFDESWELVETVPFYRLELRRYVIGE